MSAGGAPPPLFPPPPPPPPPARGGAAGRRSLLIVLSIAFWGAAAWSAVRPFLLEDYLLEIATPLLGFAALFATRRRFPFTTLAYALFFAEGLVLVVGAHYTHERVPPFDWIRDAFHLSRNHYDRFAHTAVGFCLVIPFREILRRGCSLRGGWLAALSGASILALAAAYEIFEWWVAVSASPAAGSAFLGSQGDPWDAQQDMLCDFLGALAGLAVLSRAHDREILGLQGRSGETGPP